MCVTITNVTKMQQGATPMEHVNPPRLGPARGFSHATRAGDLLWTGGQTGSDESGRIVAPGDLVAQFAQAVRNVGIALEAAGCRPEDAVKLTYYVTDVAGDRANPRPLGAASGAVLAAAADLRVLAESATFQFLFTQVGLSGGDMGVCWLLPRLVGLGRATELLMLGGRISSAEALGMGLANRVVPDGELDEAVDT